MRAPTSIAEITRASKAPNTRPSKESGVALCKIVVELTSEKTSITPIMTSKTNGSAPAGLRPRRAKMTALAPVAHTKVGPRRNLVVAYPTTSPPRSAPAP
jgi:hypothetical protein